jgi:hypothetical protein
MTSESSNAQKVSKAKASKPKKMSLERLMVMFTLFFIGGVLILVIVPEEHAARGIIMSVYSVAVFWAMFRFGI